MNHNCQEIEGRLIDLVFDELDGASRARLLTEVGGCARCREQYRSMTETLAAFDRAASVALPAEDYWAGYEARLRTRLDEAARPGAWARLAGWLAWRPVFGLPLGAAVALLLAALALGVWLNTRQPARRDEGMASAIQPPTPAPVPTKGTELKVAEPPREPRRAPKLKRVAPAPTPAVEVPEMAPVVAPIIARAEVPFFGPETVRHLEKAQRLLRSFRNARPLPGEPVYDLVYEKKQSRELIYQNMLLRRDAEAKGNLPAEELLGSLEPLLLDIANLGARPSPEEVGEIKERLQNKEIIARLQVYTALPALVGSRGN